MTELCWECAEECLGSAGACELDLVNGGRFLCAWRMHMAEGAAVPVPGDVVLARVFERAYAAAHGYFWQPCVRCLRWTGGHEPWGDSIPLQGGMHHGTCCKRPSGGETADTMWRLWMLEDMREDYHRRTGIAHVDVIRWRVT